MISFIKKTVNELEGVLIESQRFLDLDKCVSDINKGKAIVPDYIVSSSMSIYDITYDNSTILIVKEKDFNAVVDILLNGLNGASKSDDFVINTIKSIHSDKIRATSCNKKNVNNSDMLKLIHKCRQDCVDALTSGSSTRKKIVGSFFELKSSLGLNISQK